MFSLVFADRPCSENHCDRAVNLGVDLKQLLAACIEIGDYVGDCIVHMISASNALIARDPDAVRRFLAGWFDTIAFMRRNKAETVALARGESGFDEAIETREYDLGMPMFSADGSFTAPALANLKNLLVHNHVIAETADLTPLFTEQFLAKR